MTCRLLLALRCFGIGALLISSTFAAPAPAPWLKLEAPGFTIYSDATEKHTLAWALRYAAFRQAFAEFFAPPGRTLSPSIVLLFRNGYDFYDTLPAGSHPTKSDHHLTNYASIVDGTRVSGFTLDGGRDRAMEAALEAETIGELRQLDYALPIWALQGAGRVLSAPRITRNQCIIGELSGYVMAMPFTWAQFFSINTSSPISPDSRDHSLYLIQSGCLMHWILLADDHTKERFVDLATRLRTQNATDAVAAVMQTPADRFERAIRQHLRKGRRRSFPFDEAAVRATFRLTPAPPAEVLVWRAELLADRKDPAPAAALLAQARALAPNLPLVQEATARQAARAGQRHDALLAYRAAIAAGTKNPLTYLRSAQGRLDDSRRGAYDVQGEGGHEAEVAADELRTALKLDPTNRDAYVQLGRAFFVTPHVTLAMLDELAPGLTPDAQGARVRYYRALLASRLGRHDDALADFRLLADDPSLDDGARAQARDRFARETLARDLIRAEALLRAKDYAAVRALSTAGAATASAADAARYRKLAALADAEEAWDALAALAETERWPEIHAAADKYVTDFPASPHTNDAYDLLVRSAFPDRATRP